MKMKYLFKIFPGATPKSDNKEYWDGDIRWITPADFNTSDKYVSQGKRNITEAGYAASNTTLVPSGSLIVSKRAPVGLVCISLNAVCTNQGCLSCVPKEDVNSEYYYYVLSVFQRKMESLASGTTFLEISANAFANMDVPYADINMQKQIADYLKRHCVAIDSTISRHQQIIEKLEEYRKSVITQAVTKGLNPDAEMIPVHQEWISNIPKGWQVLRLKFVMDNYDFQRRPVESSKRTQNSEILYDYYGATGIIDKIDGYTCEGKKILIGEDGANLLLRNIKLIYTPTGKYWVNNHTHILYPKGNNNIDYFAAQMECIDYTKYITGSAQPKLSQRNLNNVLLVVPPIDEQNEIAEFVNNKTSFINETIERHKNIMNKLQEYKQSLIYNAVTGKIDCRTTE